LGISPRVGLLDQKLLKGAIIPGTLFVFIKDGSLFIFDCKASTVTFYNITFVYRNIVTSVGPINNFTLTREKPMTPPTPHN
jgi:hypothetical protein